jgi:translation elongation factor EF-Tu-like GTPase
MLDTDDQHIVVGTAGHVDHGWVTRHRAPR